MPRLSANHDPHGRTNQRRLRRERAAYRRLARSERAKRDPPVLMGPPEAAEA